MTFLRWPMKCPGDVLDYTIDYSRFLSPDDSIILSTWTVPAGLTVSVSTYTATTTTAFIGGVGSGSLMDIQNSITTAQGRYYTETVTLPVGISS